MDCCHLVGRVRGIGRRRKRRAKLRGQKPQGYQEAWFWERRWRYREDWSDAGALEWRARLIVDAFMLQGLPWGLWSYWCFCGVKVGTRIGLGSSGCLIPYIRPLTNAFGLEWIERHFASSFMFTYKNNDAGTITCYFSIGALVFAIFPATLLLLVPSKYVAFIVSAPSLLCQICNTNFS